MRGSRAKVGGWAWLLLAAGALLGVACEGRSATAADCRLILDRIVELEVRERGYRDPALLARKRDELARVFSGELRHCQGRALPRGALECVRLSRSSEEISHRCLR